MVDLGKIDAILNVHDDAGDTAAHLDGYTNAPAKADEVVADLDLRTPIVPLWEELLHSPADKILERSGCDFLPLPVDRRTQPLEYRVRENSLHQVRLGGIQGMRQHSLRSRHRPAGSKPIEIARRRGLRRIGQVRQAAARHDGPIHLAATVHEENDLAEQCGAPYAFRREAARQRSQ